MRFLGLAINEPINGMMKSTLPDRPGTKHCKQ